MNLAALEEVFHAARGAAQWLSQNHNQDLYQAEVDVLSALCLIIPNARLRACIATSTMQPQDPARGNHLVIEERYAVQLEDGSLWNLAGPLSQEAFQQHARQCLTDAAAKAIGTLTSPVDLEIDQDVKVDALDPLVMEAVNVLAPRIAALNAASTLEASTAVPGRASQSPRL